MNDLKHVISHELVHIYQHIKTNGERLEYTLSKNKTISLLSNNEIWKDFYFFIYFTLNLEMNTRIHQILSELKENKVIEFEKLLIELNKIKPYLDFKRAENFNPESILEINNIDELLEKVHQINPKFPTNKNKFVLVLKNIKKNKLGNFKQKLFKSIFDEINLVN
jgi:hypothetical protein